ncbi:MAG: molybdopterin-dependent oxidoreductase [Chloroflexi bacterium]|nr:molybdopterin-dependent oxidoreductase [Chloroflexota bacterium]
MGYSVIGKRMPRVDGLEKATGVAVFTDDIVLPNMLHGKILRSRYPHARILSIDTSRAEELPGVRAVVTAKDAPEVNYGPWLRDQTVFARNKVRFLGEEVAAVAATDLDTAEEALDLIQVNYEELPAVFDPFEALRSGAPAVHEDLDNYESLYPMLKHGNVCSTTKFYHGDVDKAFADSYLVVEDTFKTQSVHQSYMEPRVVVAVFDASGRLTVWTSTQSVYTTIGLLAVALQMPMTKIRCIAPRVGGGFGGKMDPLIEPFAALLARKAKKPVKIALTREEELIGTNPRHACTTHLKLGVGQEGVFQALEADIVYDGGAYAHEGPGVTDFGAIRVRGPYKVPNVNIVSRCVYTNKTVAGAFRGYGNPQVSFARESLLDVAAEKLGMDPVEFRLKNLVSRGDSIVTGQVLHSVGIRDCLTKATERAGWGKPPTKADRAIGFACLEHTAGILASAAFLKINEDGTVLVLTGAIEIGGGQQTILAQIAAEELGVPLEHIGMVMGDTDATAYDWATVASRTTYNVGNAVKIAATDAKKQLLEMAAERLEARVEDLEIVDAIISVKGAPDRGVSVREVSFDAHYHKGGPILGRGSFYPEEPSRDPSIMAGVATALWPTHIYGTQVAEVEVDRDTGQVKVVNMVAAHDVGTAINPLNIEGQIEGGLTIGLGYALSEEILFDGGKTLNPSLIDYKLPTAADVPPIEPIIVEDYDPTGPFGAKGVGEPGLVATAPAIANAVYRAVGVRIKDLPITPEKVLRALKEKEGARA